MILDFKEIPQANTGNGDQDTFELFSRDFLECAGYKIIEEPNRGPDGKKDMIVEEVLMGVDTSTSIRWLVSCKHYAHSGKAVSDSDEINITERLTQHNCNGFMGVYSTMPTSGLSELLQGALYKYRIFDHEQIEKKIIELKEKGWMLTQRYFQKSAKQISPHDLGINEPKQSWEKMDDQLKKTLLSCAILYRSNHNSSISHQKGSLLQQTILSILIYNNGASIGEIANIFHKVFHRNIDTITIEDLLQEMKSRTTPQEVQINGDKWSVTDVIKTKLKESENISKENLNKLIEDILELVRKNYSGSIDIRIKQTLTENTKKVLNTFFRLYGSDILINSSKINGDYQKREILNEKASKNLQNNKPLVDALLYSIGQIIENPSSQQADTLETYVDAFISAEIMQVDPSLNACKKERFQNKIFFLDTDIVLHSIVPESSLYDDYQRMIKKLISLGCNVIIPPQVTEEVIANAKGATLNYKDNTALYEAEDRAALQDDYHNVFVDGFIVSKAKDPALTIQKYMENYYMPKQSRMLMFKVYDAFMPLGVEYGEEISILNSVVIPSLEKEQLSSEIYQSMISEPRGEKREDATNKYLSINDAQMYLSAYHLAREANEGNAGLLDKDCYIVTNSTRTVRCAYKVRLYKDIITKPILLEKVLSEIVSFDEGCESLDLLGNPFLSVVAYNNRETLTKLARLGVDLRGRKIPRLIVDLETALKEDLTKEVEADLYKEEMEMQISQDTLAQYDKIAKKVNAAGYDLMPAAQDVVNTFRQQQKDNEQQAKEIAQLKQKRQKKDRNQLRYEQSLSTKKSLSKKEIKNKLQSTQFINNLKNLKTL